MGGPCGGRGSGWGLHCRGRAGRAGPSQARGGAYGAWPELAGGSQADVTPSRRVLEHEPYLSRPGVPSTRLLLPPGCPPPPPPLYNVPDAQAEDAGVVAPASPSSLLPSAPRQGAPHGAGIA